MSDCPICFELLNAPYKTPCCKQPVHEGCLIKQFKPTCPFCRAHLDIKVTGKPPSHDIDISEFLNVYVVSDSTIGSTTDFVDIMFPERDNPYEYFYEDKEWVSQVLDLAKSEGELPRHLSRAFGEAMYRLGSNSTAFIE